MRDADVTGPATASVDENKKGTSPMQLTLKEFRHLAQGTQSIVTSAAIIAVVALAWHAFKTYHDTPKVLAETLAED